MADEPSVVTQQRKTDFAVTDAHIVKVSSVKRLGIYRKNELKKIRELFIELIDVLNNPEPGYYELYNNQKITEVRLEKSTTSLITDSGFPGNATGDKRKLLFFTDWVALLIDIANFIQDYYPSETLAYIKAQDPQALLKDWGSEADGKISQVSLQRDSAQMVVKLFSNISRQLDYLAETETASESEEDDDEETSDPEEDAAKAETTANDDDWTSSANVTQPQDADGGDGEAPDQYSDDTPINREDTDVQKHIATEINWVFNAARVNLLQQFLDAAGIDANNLPPGLQAQLTGLEDALRDELYRITDSLSDADLRQLLNHRFRLSLYRQLLTNILANPANPFYTELLAFYREFTRDAVQTVTTDKQADLIRQFELAFTGTDSTDTENEALQAIHQEVQAWIAELRREFATEATDEPEETDAQTEPDDEQPPTDAEASDQILTQTDIELVPSVPPAQAAFSTAQAEQLASSFETVVSLPAAERQALQNQSARLVWGAAAEIFGDTSNIPPQLINTISGHAVDYLLTLSPEELTKLSKSPISLLNHLRKFSKEVRQDLRFQLQAEQFAALRQNPDVSRAELIEREVEVGYAVVIEALFYEKGVTEYKLAQEPKLVAEFESIKTFIREELYVELSQLSVAELQALVTDMASQERFLAQFERELLQGNPQLARYLRTFLRHYIAHLQNTGQVREAEAAQSILIDYSGELELTETPQARRERVRTELAEEASSAEVTSRQVVQTSGPTQEEPTENSDGQGLIQTSSEAVRKKKSLLNNLLENEWKGLSTEEKVAVYLHYDYPVPKKFRGSNPDLQLANEYLVLVPEFLELDRQNLLPILVYNLSHPSDGKSELTLDAPLTAERLAKLEKEKQVSDRALNAELENSARQLDPETHRQLVQYAQQEQAARQTVLQEILLRNQQELAVLAQAYSIEVAQIQQLAQQEAFIQEVQALQAVEALQALEQAAALDADPELSGNLTGWRDQFAQAMNLSSRRGSAKEALQQKLINRFAPSKEQLAKKGMQQLATKLGAGAVAAPLAVAATAYTLLQDPRTRDMLIGGLGYMTALALQAFSNVAGLAVFLGVTGAVAFIPGIGFLAIPAGLMAGSLAASLFPNAPSLLGVRMPPAPWGELSESGPGLRELRANQAAQAEAAQAQQAAEASGQAEAAEASRANAASRARAAQAEAAEAANEGGEGNGQGTAEASVKGSATASAATSTASGWLAAIPFWGLATMGGFTLVFLLSWSVILVIMGAFMAPVPTRLSDYVGGDTIGTPTQSQYVTVTKTAQPSQVENLGSGDTVTIDYTITIEPKAEYSLELNSVKDTVSGFGDVVPNLDEYSGRLISEDLPTDRITDPITISYSIDYSGTITDALINNSVLFSMTVYDAYDFPVKQNETVTAVGNLRVGDPVVGCWPTDGRISQLPFNKYFAYSHDGLDAYDILNSIGTPVYAPFPGELCDKGLDKKASGGYGYHASLTFSLGSNTASKPLTLFFGHFVNQPLPGLGAGRCKQVAAGEIIGYMDDTGFSSTSHLHYELLSNPYGIRLKDLIIGSAQVEEEFRLYKQTGQDQPTVQHCFNR